MDVSELMVVAGNQHVNLTTKFGARRRLYHVNQEDTDEMAQFELVLVVRRPFWNRTISFTFRRAFWCLRGYDHASISQKDSPHQIRLNPAEV